MSSPIKDLVKGIKAFRVGQEHLLRDVTTGRVQFINLDRDFNKDFAVVFFVKNLNDPKRDPDNDQNESQVKSNLSHNLLSCLSQYLSIVLDEDNCVRVETINNRISVLAPLFGLVNIDEDGGVEVFKIMNNCRDECWENSKTNADFNEIKYVPQIKLFARNKMDQTICVRNSWTVDRNWINENGNVYDSMCVVFRKIYDYILDQTTALMVVDKDTFQ